MGLSFMQETQEVLTWGCVNFSRGRCDVLARHPLIIRNDDFSGMCIATAAICLDLVLSFVIFE